MADLSLNEIVSVLASRSNQNFSAPLMSELKAIVHYKRANYTQQLLEKHPEQRKFFQQSFTSDLERISSKDCEIPVVTCDILRTTCAVPTPLRSSFTLFDFVGTPDWTTPFGEIAPEYIKLTKYNRFTKDKPKWAYINSKIYVFNDLSLKKVALRGIFSDPSAVNSCCSSTTQCYDDDARYPISEDILNSIIRDILNVELRNNFPQQGVVSVPETKDANVPTNT